MRIERLTDNRVRVTVTAADLTGLNIRVEQLRPNSKELHTFLFSIMETIRSETDFNPYSGQVVVEAMPSKDGISIIVSKLNEEPLPIALKKNRKLKSVTAKIKMKEPYIFVFKNMTDFCGAAVRLEKDAILKSSLYKLENSYCLILNGAEKFNRSVGILSEFASRRARQKLRVPFIQEHGKLIAENEKLLDMTDGIKSLGEF